MAPWISSEIMFGLWVITLLYAHAVCIEYKQRVLLVEVHTFGALLSIVKKLSK